MHTRNEEAFLAANVTPDTSDERARACCARTRVMPTNRPSSSTGHGKIFAIMLCSRAAVQKGSSSADPPGRRRAAAAAAAAATAPAPEPSLLLARRPPSRCSSTSWPQAPLKFWPFSWPTVRGVPCWKRRMAWNAAVAPLWGAGPQSCGQADR